MSLLQLYSLLCNHNLISVFETLVVSIENISVMALKSARVEIVLAKENFNRNYPLPKKSTKYDPFLLSLKITKEFFFSFKRDE